MEWVSVVAIVALVGILLVGWLRRASILFTLVLAMSAVFILGIVLAGRVSISGSPLLEDLAWRPAYLRLSAWPHWYTALTTMFLHADVLHLLMNVVIFIIMGMGLEDRIGRTRFLLVFLIAGLLGTIAHSLIFLRPVVENVPVVGASGAVFGIIGAYATLYPRDRVFFFFLIIIPNVPVYIAAVVYAVVELLALEGMTAAGGVAHHAHVGGLVAGVAFALVLQRFFPVRSQLERMARPQKVDEAALVGLLQTDEQRGLHAKLIANRDEPELAAAWLDRLARVTPCPRCGSILVARAGRLRCGCGYQLPVLGGPEGAKK
jgi:membrane associated rhomboid family serine protease